MVGADLSEVRYHENIRLPDQKETQHAILIPAYNQGGKLQAELVLCINTKGDGITHCFVRGEPKGAAIVVQETEFIGSFYIIDNFVDAKSIAIGN